MAKGQSRWGFRNGRCLLARVCTLSRSVFSRRHIKKSSCANERIRNREIFVKRARYFRPKAITARSSRTLLCSLIPLVTPTISPLQSVDWWSLGVLTYELLTGASPFTVEGDKNTQADISKRILNAEPLMPDFLSPLVRDFILRLLVKDPQKRLGGGPGDAAEVKAHPFFSVIDWGDLLRRDLPAPFVPRIGSPTDVSNFSEEFTGMEAVDSPGTVPPEAAADAFAGYSFISPSILFAEDNVVADELLRKGPNPDKRPTASNLVGCIIKHSVFFATYEIDLREKILGEGSFSVCRRCVQKETGQEYAVKIVSRRVDCSREIAMLKACQGHPNVVRLVEVLRDEAHTYIVTEYLKGGELLARIRRKKRFDEAQASRILAKLMSAVNFMHFQGVVHRDLKPENLLFADDSEGSEVKVVDFGFARQRPRTEDDQGDSGSDGMRTPCFTLQYAAPEVLDQAFKDSQTDGYNEACDLWSLGVILYVMLSGRSPFVAESLVTSCGSKTRGREDTALSIMKRIKAGDFKMEGNDAEGSSWRGVSAAAKQLVRGLLTVDPRRRLSLDDLFASPWVKMGENQSGRGAEGAAKRQLDTPIVLNERPLVAERGLMQTFNAFHRVTREGGLGAIMRPPVSPNKNSNFPLAATNTATCAAVITTRHHHVPTPPSSPFGVNARCKQTKNSASSTASSSSGCSSMSAGTLSSASLSPTKQHPWFFPTLPSSTAPRSPSPCPPMTSPTGARDDRTLNVRNSSRIHDYLTSLAQMQQQHQRQQPPAVAEAVASGVSYRLLPSSPVSITPVPLDCRVNPPDSGPVTRSRKRKAGEDLASSSTSSASAKRPPSPPAVSITPVPEHESPTSKPAAWHMLGHHSPQRDSAAPSYSGNLSLLPSPSCLSSRSAVEAALVAAGHLPPKASSSSAAVSSSSASPSSACPRTVTITID